MLQVPFEILEYSNYNPENAEEQEIYEYRIYIGKNPPIKIKRHETILWHSDEQSLRKWILEGFKLQPWQYEDEDNRKLPQQKWIAGKLWNLRNIPKQQPGYCKYEVDENWDCKLVILIENESYRPHAEVVLRAILLRRRYANEFITSVFSDKTIADKYGFDFI